MHTNKLRAIAALSLAAGTMLAVSACQEGNGNDPNQPGGVNDVPGAPGAPPADPGPGGDNDLGAPGGIIAIPAA